MLQTISGINHLENILKDLRGIHRITKYMKTLYTAPPKRISGLIIFEDRCLHIYCFSSNVNRNAG